MSRTQTINETLAILGKILPEQGFDELNADKLQEIYTTIENDKNQKDIIASELGFKFRKRSIKKDSSPDEEHKPKKVTRKSGYALFPGDESKYIDRIQELKGSTDDDGKEITAIKARAIVWKELSEAEKEPFNDKATQLNRDNGFEEKKTPSPKQTKLTKAQLEQQLHDSQELLRQNGVTDMPAPPPREVKPKKAKKDDGAVEFLTALWQQVVDEGELALSVDVCLLCVFGLLPTSLAPPCTTPSVLIAERERLVQRLRKSLRGGLGPHCR